MKAGFVKVSSFSSYCSFYRVYGTLWNFLTVRNSDKIVSLLRSQIFLKTLLPSPSICPFHCWFLHFKFFFFYFISWQILLFRLFRGLYWENVLIIFMFITAYVYKILLSIEYCCAFLYLTVQVFTKNTNFHNEG